jgi:hypothetical protein
MLQQPRVNLIGRGSGWVDAPKDELSWGITLTNLNRDVDLVIDMNVYEDDRWGVYEKELSRESRKRANEKGIPYIDLASYPIDKILNYFHVDYFTCTVDYAIALAIYRGFQEIGIYGVSMIGGQEYAYQKPGVEHWIGQAMGRGIKIKGIGGVSSLLRTKCLKMYGYHTPQKGLIYAS